MPQTKFQGLVFAFITVIITVPCFVFYCSSLEAQGFTIDVITGSLIFIPIEFVLAFSMEILVGAPLSKKIAFKTFDSKEVSPFIFETVIICATVCIMCPLMSFLATIMYDGIIACGIYGEPFMDFLPNFVPFWLQHVVVNFPFALLSQLFFIQPLVRKVFKRLYKRQNTNKML